jgi:ABC-type uncharacterized transport system involved in gliding motility auxiliary subunit
VKRLVGLLGWLGVVLVLAAVALRFIRPDLQVWVQRLAMAGLVVVGLYALSQWRDIARSFQGRNVRYGSLAAGSIVLFLAILVGINWIGNRQNKRWDLTAGDQFSLSEQTRQILQGLDEPVTIRAFYQAQTATGLEQMRDRLEPYAYESSQVQIEYIDPDQNPTVAKQYEIQQYGTIVVEYAGRTERTTMNDEQSVTNALKKVIEGQAKKIYFVQGHGERDPDVTEARGYSGIAQGLRSDNFEVGKITLAQAGSVPDDASVLVIAGPRTDLFEPEVAMVRDFLGRQGKLLLSIDPPEQLDDPEPTSLIALAREWGIEVGNNIVVDNSGLGQLVGTSASSPIGMPLRHPITEQFQLITAFPFTRSATPVEGGVDGRFAQKVVETNPQSWAETDLKRLYGSSETEMQLDSGDIAGPITIAAAVAQAGPAPDAAATPPGEAPPPTPEARMVVVGDSDFASNRALGIPGNRDLFLNMANWLAQQEDLIAIRPKNPEDSRLTLTEDQQAQIGWLTFLGIPGLLFANAVRIWWKRR